MRVAHKSKKVVDTASACVGALAALERIGTLIDKIDNVEAAAFSAIRLERTTGGDPMLTDSTSVISVSRLHLT